MAFLRRKGSAYYLVHNVRRAGKVKQLHLARLGERPRITDDVVRQVSRAYPFVDVNWSELRQQVNDQVELFDPKSAYVRKLLVALRSLNLDLADLFPPLLDVIKKAQKRDYPGGTGSRKYFHLVGVSCFLRISGQWL